MKRKIISLFCSLLSVIAAIVYIMIAVVLLSRVIGAKEYIPTADSNIWLIKVLTRLKQAGFNLFFSIMGIVLTSVLALYRLALAYFYNKVSKTEDSTYKARLGEIVFFAFFAVLATIAIAWFCFDVEGILPPQVQPFLLALFIIYILLCALPLVEIAIVYAGKFIKSKPIKSVLTKDGVVNELDELAYQTALAVAHKQEEKKEQEIAPISNTTKQEPTIAVSKQEPITAIDKREAEKVVIPRVRKVEEYVTPYWDKEDNTVSLQMENDGCTKTGIRKKNRKPSYNSARLRIRKPISRRRCIKIVSPVTIRLGFKKDYRRSR